MQSEYGLPLHRTSFPNFQPMYPCDFLLAHMDRDQDWLRQQNIRARQVRLLPLGTERAWGLPWLQPMHRHIYLADVVSAYDIVVPSNMWMQRQQRLVLQNTAVEGLSAINST